MVNTTDAGQEALRIAFQHITNNQWQESNLKTFRTLRLVSKAMRTLVSTRMTSVCIRSSHPRFPSMEDFLDRGWPTSVQHMRLFAPLTPAACRALSSPDMFPQLEKLYYHDKHGDDEYSFPSVESSFPRLRELQVKGHPTLNALETLFEAAAGTVEKLKINAYDDALLVVEQKTWEGMTELKSIHFYCAPKYDDDMAEDILFYPALRPQLFPKNLLAAKTLNCLEEFTWETGGYYGDMFSLDTKKITQLTEASWFLQLRRLKLTIDDIDSSFMLVLHPRGHSPSPLEELELHFGYSKRSAAKLPSLPALKKLSLSGHFDAFGSILDGVMGVYLPNLEELVCCDTFYCQEADYDLWPNRSLEGLRLEDLPSLRKLRVGAKHFSYSLTSASRRALRRFEPQLEEFHVDRMYPTC